MKRKRSSPRKKQGMRGDCTHVCLAFVLLFKVLNALPAFPFVFNVETISAGSVR